MAGKFIDATLRLVDKFSKPMSDAVMQMAQGSKKFMAAGRQIEKAGQSMQGAGKKMAAAMTAPLAGLGITAVKTAADFEGAMSNVQAISGASAGELGRLTDKAKEMGAKTKFSATESADAFSYMAMAGWKTEDMLNGIEGIMYLAGASGEDLAQTSDIVTDALTAFGMTASDTNEFVDILAKASSNANTNVSLMGETFKYVAPVAGALGYSAKDVSVAIGLMANSGIKASSAGTALRSLLTNLAKPTDSVQAAMDALGISLTDSQGEMKEFSTLMLEMRSSFSGLTEEQKAQYAASLAGKTGMSGLLAVVNASDSDFNKLTESIQNSSGAAKEMYDVANDNLNGRLTILKSTVESIAITFGEKLMPYVEKGVGKIQALADKFSALSDKQVDQIVHWAAMAAAAGPLVMVLGKTTSSVGTVVKTFGLLGKSMPDIAGRAQAAGKILKTIDFMPKIPGTGLFQKAFSGIGKTAGIALKPFAAAGKAISGLAGKSKLLGIAGKGIGTYFGGFGKIAGKVLSPFTKLGGAVGSGAKALFTFLGPANSVILVLGALMVAGVAVYKNWDKLAEGARKAGNYIKSVFEACGFDFEFFRGKLESGGAKFGEFAAKAQEMWVVVSPYLAKAGELFKAVFEIGLGAAIGSAIGLLGSLFQSASEIFSGLMTSLGGLMDFITGVFTGNWAMAWNGVKSIFSGVFSSLVALAKTPINGVISIINGAIAGINKLGVKIPDWVPLLGGKEFKLDIPKIPMLYRGTDYWQGGPAMIHDRGAEIVDLPRGTRVYPHDKSIRMARQEGNRGSRIVNIAKLADSINITEAADVDEIMERFVKKLEAAMENTA